jgi:hypothetical protein
MITYNVPQTRIKYENITMAYTVKVITIDNFGLHYCSDYQIEYLIINLSIQVDEFTNWGFTCYLFNCTFLNPWRVMLFKLICIYYNIV